MSTGYSCLGSDGGKHWAVILGGGRGLHSVLGADARVRVVVGVNYILVMLFVKYISDVWNDHRERYLKEFGGDQVRVQRRLSRERFKLPDGCDFQSLYENRNQSDIGERIDVALADIDLNQVKTEIARIESELATVRGKMDGYLKELGL
jgi:type I restriction-modification system DNA methylase subunit